VELFKCARAPIKLLPKACGERWRKAKTPTEPGSAARLTYSMCAGCPVGEAHAKGQTPDVQVEDVVAHGSGQTNPPRSETESQAAETPPAKEMTSDPVVESQEEPMAKKFKPKACAGCGEMFSPRSSGAQLYCTAACKSGGNAAPPKRKPRKPSSAAITTTQAPDTPTAVVELPSVRVDPTQGPAALLQLAGYKVRSIDTPRGQMLFVEDS